MIINTSAGDLDDSVIERRVIREQYHDGNKAIEIHYFHHGFPITINGSKGELNLYPKQLSLAGEQGEVN